MKEISYDDWQARFEIHSGDLDWGDIEVQKDSLKFFDNGAVQDAEGDFVVKCDNVWAR